MTRKVRRIERMEFGIDEVTQVVAYMARLASAKDGWINLIPGITNDDEMTTSLGFLTLVGGGGIGFTMCTWVPGSLNRRGLVQPRLGITHVTRRRAVAELYSLGVPVPESWLVEQDHPRRGLVLRMPSEESHEHVLAWALRAVGALSTPSPARRWRADIYLPVTS
ncbi:MAG: hypothetical protein ACLQRM_20430 [Acidimicrobiales bacterium]